MIDKKLSRQDKHCVKLYLFASATSLFLIITALVLEHLYHIAPCVKCIEQRILVLVICIATLLGAALEATRHRIYSIILCIISLSSALHAIIIAAKHSRLQRVFDPTATCSLKPWLFDYIPLDDYMPWLFKAYGSCDKINWTVLDFTLPEVLILFLSLLICTLGLSLYLSIRAPLRSITNRHNSTL